MVSLVKLANRRREEGEETAGTFWKRQPLLTKQELTAPASKEGDLLNLMIEGQVIVELKAVEGLRPVHEAQLITYLKLTGCRAGLLINFNEVLLKNGLRRLDRPDLYHAKRLHRSDS